MDKENDYLGNYSFHYGRNCFHPSKNHNLDAQPSSVKNFAQPELADDNYDDDNIEKITLEEVRTQLPFLQGAPEKTIRAFYELLNDPDMPSERRRQELVKFPF